MKRNLFSELKEGLDELRKARDGEAMLRTVDVEIPDDSESKHLDPPKPADNK